MSVIVYLWLSDAFIQFDSQIKSPLCTVIPVIGDSVESIQRMGLGFVIGSFGVLVLAHAAYSTIQYRGLLNIMAEEFSGPPMNVVTELLLGLVFCMWAGLTVPGKFLSIHPDSEENSFTILKTDFGILSVSGSLLQVHLRI